MSLKSMLEESKSEETSTDLNLLEQQNEKIAELSSENSMLRSELQKKSETIKSLNERIGMQSESDNVLKNNEQLKNENEQLKREKQEALKEAEEVVRACKSEYAEKERILSKEREKAEQTQKQAEADKKNVEAITKKKAIELYVSQKNSLERKYKALTTSHEVLLYGSMLYGILITVFSAVRSERFASDFIAFFKAFGLGIYKYANWVEKGAKWASQLGDKIPQEIVSVIVHWLLYVIVILVLFVGAGGLIVYLGYKLVAYYKKHLMDWKSVVCALLSLAVVVFFAEPIRSFLPVNLILVLLIVQLVYIGTRSYLNKDNYAF